MKTLNTASEKKSTTRSVADSIKKTRSPKTLGIQAKLTIGKANDKYEQEADRVADKVLSMPEPITQKQIEEEPIQEKSIVSQITHGIQKESYEEEAVQEKSIRKQEEKEKEPVQTKLISKQSEEEEPVQTKFIQKQSEEEEEQPVQAKFIQKQVEDEEPVQEKPVMTKPKGSKSQIASSWVESKINNTKGGGNPLSKDTRSFMENRFGADFSKVNIHTNSNAVQMNKEINAQAFTHGSDVYFNSGKYNSETSDGKHLLAHELTHVVQQRGTRVSPSKIHRDPLNGNSTETAEKPSVKLLRDILDDVFVDEQRAIDVFKQLSVDELNNALYDNTLMVNAQIAFNDSEMLDVVSHMIDKKANLKKCLQWLFLEGNSWADIKFVLNKADSSDRVKLYENQYLKDKFQSLCTDEELLELVKILGGTSWQQYNWLIEYEKGLAEYILTRESKAMVFKILMDVRENHSTSLDNVCFYYALDIKANGIKELLKNEEGKSIVIILLTSMASGWDTGVEQDLIDAIMLAAGEQGEKDIKEVKSDKDKGGINTKVEVITFLKGWGAASDSAGTVFAGGAQGHTAISVGDRLYSFEGSGWVPIQSKYEYLQMNRERRSGIGQIINLTDQQATKLKAYLEGVEGTGSYVINPGNATTGVCTTETIRSLTLVLDGLNTGRWDPQTFAQDLEKLKDTAGNPIVKGRRFYPMMKEDDRIKYVDSLSDFDKVTRMLHPDMGKLENDRETKIKELIILKFDESMANALLFNKRYKGYAIDILDNEEMYEIAKALVKKGGNLKKCLEWMFSEGTSWEYVKNVLKVASAGKDEVLLSKKMKIEFGSLCDNDEMIEAVKLLEAKGSIRVNWLVYEGVNVIELDK